MLNESVNGPVMNLARYDIFSCVFPNIDLRTLIAYSSEIIQMEFLYKQFSQCDWHYIYIYIYLYIFSCPQFR